MICVKFIWTKKIGGSCLADYCLTNTEVTLPSYHLSCFSTRKRNNPKGNVSYPVFQKKTTQVYFYDGDCFIATFAFIHLMSRYYEGVEF